MGLFSPKKNKKRKKYQPALHLTEPELFDDEEGTFIDYFTRRRVFVHLVPAPWSRVIVLSMCYALAITFVKFVIVKTFGRPEWHIVAPAQPLDAAYRSEDPG